MEFGGGGGGRGCLANNHFQLLQIWTEYFLGKKGYVYAACCFSFVPGIFIFGSLTYIVGFINFINTLYNLLGQLCVDIFTHCFFTFFFTNINPLPNPLP